MELHLIFFLGLILIAGAAISGLALGWKNPALLGKFNLFILLAAILISIAAVKTAATGGMIRHDEINKGIQNR